MHAQDPDNERPNASQLDTVQERLAALERMLANQHERMALQEEEIQRLRAELAGSQAEPEAAGELILPASAKRAPGRKGTSRRSLLKFGGIAAAAGAAAVAANVVGSQTARASGTAWQTGTVTADTETLVKPGPSYASSDMLQLQLGTGSVYYPLGPSGTNLKAALAAYDTTTNNIGVYGTSSTGYGVFGVTDTGTGAQGAGLNGAANSSGTGVAGSSQSGVGVQGNSASGLGGVFTGGQAPIALALGGSPGAPTTGVHIAGEVYLDSNGTIWICQQSGDFGTSTHPVFYPLSGIVLLPNVVRVVGGSSSYKGLPGVELLGAGATQNHNYTFGVDTWVPPYAKAIFGNATCHSMPIPGHLDLWPGGLPRPNASTVNYVPSDVPLSNFCIVGLGTTGSFQRAFDAASYATCGFLYDLSGYIV